MIKKNNYLIIIVIVCVVIIIGVLSWGFLTNWGSKHQSNNTNKNNPTFKIEAEKRKKDDERLFETKEIEAEKRKKDDERLFKTKEEIKADQEAKIKADQEAKIKKAQEAKIKKAQEAKIKKAKIDEKIKKLMEEIQKREARIEKRKKEEENLKKASPGDFCDDNTKCISGKCGDGRCCQNWIKKYKNVRGCNYSGGVKSCHKGDRNQFGYGWNCQKQPFRPIILGSTSFSFTTFSPENNNIIKTNLMRYGPILVQIYNGKRFKDYYWNKINKNTIYTFNQSEKSGGGNHLVVIIGYNQIIINGKPINYWIMTNSFGKNFANNGFFAVKMEPDVIKAALYLNNSNTSGVIKTDFMKINSSNLQEATEYNSPDISFNKLYNADNTTSNPVPTGAVPQSQSESFYASLNSYETTYSNGISPDTATRFKHNFSWMHPSQNLYNQNFISSLRSQGDSCGSCYVFASIILLEFRVSMWHFNNSNPHTPKNIHLSIQNMLERFIPPGRDGYLYNKVCDGATITQIIESFNTQSYDIAAEKDCPYDCKPETCGRMRQQYFCDGTSTIDLGPGDRCYRNNECKSGKCKGGFCCTSSGLSNKCTKCQSKKDSYPGHCAHYI